MAYTLPFLDRLDEAKAPAAGICLVPQSVRKSGRGGIVFIDLDEPRLTSPIIMSFRTSDTSVPLSNLRSLVSEFDNWKGPATPG